MSEYPCPVCGFGLWFAPWRGESAADEICPCCGIQFGYDDAAGGAVETRHAIYTRWRADWAIAGMPWRGEQPAPVGWDPDAQLRRVASAAEAPRVGSRFKSGSSIRSASDVVR